MTLQDLENQRKQLITSSQTLVGWFFGITIVIVLINIYLAVNDKSKFGQLAWYAGIFIFVFVLSNFLNKKDLFNKNYKKLIIPHIIKRISPQFLYGPEKSIDINIILESRLVLPNYTSFVGEDHIMFNTFGNLQICESLMYKHVEKDYNIIYLQGLFGFATFPFSFSGTTVLRPKDQSFQAFNGEKVRLESPRFMEIWDVQTDNQVGARMALGTDIMNNLLYLNDSLNVPISMSFIGNKVYFAISQKSFLEPSFYESVFDSKEVQKFTKELSVIHEIVQTFKLRQNK
jgi:Protein of unknown function (DUF3137)